MLRVIHVAPHLPPQNSGVGDYASLVGRRMEEIADVRCAFVAAGQAAVDTPANGPHVRNITDKCDAHSLWQAVEELATTESSPGPSANGRGAKENSPGGGDSVAVVLNFSGYGYERNGCPVWLIDALRSRPQWVERVVTFFHELYATGRPWQRAFWYSARQRRITAEIAQLSDAVLTNSEQSARWLEQVTGRPTGSVTSLPVPSNVGEPEHVPVIASRPPRAVTFGGARSKRFALYDEALCVTDLLQGLGITQLLDVGAVCPIDRRTFERAGIAVRQLGYLDAPRVSRELCGCCIGFLDYPLAAVAKSGVFAAYAAHGIVPVLRVPEVGTMDRITFGEQALALPVAVRSRPSVMQLQRVSESVCTWYRGGSAEAHAKAFLQLTVGAPTPSRPQSHLSIPTTD